jgi:DNA-binding SARP family transcriptional activator/putative ubiquitin-RnfH superfamily antitoxin RatB of RatAB toxin-antitoxin module
MQLRLLGPLELVVGRQQINIGGLRQRAVLSMLALNANRVTSVNELVEALWNTAPPETARAQIQTCVSGLRKLFSDNGHPGMITTRPPGYILQIAATDLDSEEFATLVGAAHAHADAGRLADASAALGQALGLWRGPALADVDSDLVQRGAARFEDNRLAAIEERVRIDLALGKHREIISELGALTNEYPLSERLTGFRMLALYRSGRQADALEVGRRIRVTLVEELGIEPGPELRRLETAILNRDPELDLREVDLRPDPAPDTAENRVVPTAEPAVIPRQLPASIADFTGREAQLDEIRQILAGDHSTDWYAMRIVAISGKGGVGKSSLAVRVAHELGDAFPDGVLYGDLHNPDGDITSKLLARFLRALGISGSTMPDDTEERVELYRSLLADKKMLVVLDDVTSEEQVQALLPGSPTCAVITTSRMRMSGLSGATLVDIDVLDTGKSMELLAKIVDSDRVRAEESATVELVRLCGGLPLALRIAGARLTSRPHWSIGALVRRLSAEAGGLDELAYRGLELRANIDLTYRSLSAQASRLLRLLTLIPAPDIAEWTAAALLDTDLTDAADVLENLVDVQLLDTVQFPGKPVRYRLHNLIRIYALEQLMRTESRADRDQVMERALGAWLALASAAHRKEYGGPYTILHGNAPRWSLPPDWETALPDKPMDWWNAEHRSLVAAVRKAAEADMDELCWDLALTSVTLFETGGHFDDWRETAQLGLEITRRTGNRTGEAAMLYSLGTLNMFQKRLADAQRYLDSALEMFEADGNTHGCALVLRNAAIVDGLVGNTETMLRKNTEALKFMRSVGDRMGEAQILRNMASFWMDEGDLDVARDLLEEALGICRDVHCLRGEAQVLHRFAYLHLTTGQIELAGQAFEQVLGMVQHIDDRIGEAYALYGLGIVRRQEGQLESAVSALFEALSSAKTVGERMVEGQVHYALGEIGVSRGETEGGATHLTKACELFAELGATLWQAKALILLSEVHTGDDDLAPAGQRVEQARNLLAALDSKESNRWLARLDEAQETHCAGC